MRNGLKMVLVAGMAAGLWQASIRAADAPALTDTKEKVSYSIGMNIGSNLKRGGYEVNVDTLAGAIKDVLEGKEPKLTEQQAREVMMAYSKELQTKREEERKKTAEKNKKAGAAFLEENKGKPGIKTHSVTLPDGTTAEMQYKVVTEGTGATPKSNDVVTVNYRGTLIDGKEFDSSAKRGQPAKFPVTRVVKGWTEALQMMKTGSKWELYLPSSLAYGDYGFGQNVEPGATLIFEIELLSADAPAPAAAPQQPLTSDIIRVPSAEELKKGAKIEVIKPEEAEKRAKEAAEKEKNKTK